MRCNEVLIVADEVVDLCLVFLYLLCMLVNLSDSSAPQQVQEGRLFGRGLGNAAQDEEAANQQPTIDQPIMDDDEGSTLVETPEAAKQEAAPKPPRKPRQLKPRPPADAAPDAPEAAE